MFNLEQNKYWTSLLMLVHLNLQFTKWNSFCVFSISGRKIRRIDANERQTSDACMHACAVRNHCEWEEAIWKHQQL